MRPIKTLKTNIFCIDCFSKVALKSIIKNIDNFADKDNYVDGSEMRLQTEKN